MSHEKKTLLLPVMLITVGAGWLLSSLDVFPEIDWIWTLGLAVVGFLVIAIGGFDKFTLAVGPFFMIAACLSVLRQLGRLPLDVEVPILVITSGVLMLLVRSPRVATPSWLLETKNAD
jgi:hypothetical protein